MKTYVLSTLFAVAATAGYASAGSVTELPITFTGEQEAPNPGDPDGTGGGELTINDETNTVSWDFTYQNIGEPTAMHIHEAPAGEGGPIVVGLGVAGGPGQLTGSTTASEEQINEILDNPTNFYVNVHNDEFPAGAIRGQIPARFDLTMTGEQEAPDPGDPDGLATGPIFFNTGTSTISWEFAYENIAVPTAMHIHTGGPGEAGPILIGLGVNSSGGIGTLVSSTTADLSTIEMILGNPDGFYVNIHNQDFPAGAVRGQVSGIVPIGAPEVMINEIRIDQPGTDNDEYFELLAKPGTPLDGVTYLVIGDGQTGSGTVEAAIDLSGNIFKGSFFLAAEETFSIGKPNLTTDLNFENSDNVTHRLVFNFTGKVGDDLDTDDDCTLDSMPWDGVIDSIALIENLKDPDNECIYGDQTVGPDGPFVPGQVYRCVPEGTWIVGSFELLGDDTPGEGNLDCEGMEPCLGDINGDDAVDGADLGLLLGAFNSADADADLNDSGKVDGADLGLLLGNFGPCDR